jgi:hypothetical protein
MTIVRTLSQRWSDGAVGAVARHGRLAATSAARISAEMGRNPG